MAVAFLDIDSTSFSKDGIPFIKNFIAYGIGSDAIKIVSKYDSRFVLLDTTNVADITVDGSSYATAILLVTAIKDVVGAAPGVGGGSVAVIDHLLSTSSTSALSARQGLVLKTLIDNINITGPSIIDDLLSTSTTDGLSANQGRILKQMVDNINTILTSSDTSLDELQEIVNFISINRDTLDNLSIASIAGLQTALDDRVLKTEIIDNLTSNLPGQPLSAAQGVAIQNQLDTKVDKQTLPTLGVIFDIDFTTISQTFYNDNFTEHLTNTSATILNSSGLNFSGESNGNLEDHVSHNYICSTSEFKVLGEFEIVSYGGDYNAVGIGAINAIGAALRMTTISIFRNSVWNFDGIVGENHNATNAVTPYLIGKAITQGAGKSYRLILHFIDDVIQVSYENMTDGQKIASAIIYDTTTAIGVNLRLRSSKILIHHTNGDHIVKRLRLESNVPVGADWGIIHDSMIHYPANDPSEYLDRMLKQMNPDLTFVTSGGQGDGFDAALLKTVEYTNLACKNWMIHLGANNLPTESSSTVMSKLASLIAILDGLPDTVNIFIIIPAPRLGGANFETFKDDVKSTYEFQPNRYVIDEYTRLDNGSGSIQTGKSIDGTHTTTAEKRKLAAILTAFIKMI